MPDDLEARLKSHARAFEGLMSLIPAKEYYGKDESITSTQWQKKKKQSTEERQAAKRAKLDPASHKTAQDVLDENARKRKRELDGEADDEDRDDQSVAESTDLDLDIEKEKPLEGLKSKAKKQKKSDADATAEPEEEVQEGRVLTKAEQKAALKREKKKEKLAAKKQKLDARKATQAEFSKGLTAPKDTAEDDEDDDDEDDNDDDDDDGLEHPDDRIQAIDVSGLVEESTAASTTANSHSSTASEVSAASSTTSVPQSGEDKLAKKEKKPLKIDAKSQDEFRARLNAKLEAMRAARKADGPDGRPARNRAELIETRRKKEAERKAAKKVSRQEAKEDEARLKAEEQLARIRGGSGSPSIFPARSPEAERNFNFGKVAWEDGQELEGGLSKFLESRKKKGKSDTKTALEAAQKKQARINSYDEAKRKDIEEKDLWLNAKKRAQGEKVFDDVSLLKKSLKRQQKQKDKSKQEWKERLTNVQEGKEKRQKKREENLKKRREEKGQKGKKKGGAKKSGGKKPAKRPGFEGTFKAR